MHAQKATVIAPYSETIVPTRRLALPEDRDFLFEPSTQGKLTMYAHLMDYRMSGVLVRNDSNSSVRILSKTRLRNVTELDYDNYFQADVEADFAAIPSQLLARAPAPLIPDVIPASRLRAYGPEGNHDDGTIRAHDDDIYNNDNNAFAAPPLAAHAASAAPPAAHSAASAATGGAATSHVHNGNIIRADEPREVRCSNGVMLFSDDYAIQVLQDLVDAFPTLWVDNSFVRVPEEEWIRISLRHDWQTKVSGKAKIYPLGIQDQEVVDKTFNKMHQQGRLD